MYSVSGVMEIWISPFISWRSDRSAIARHDDAARASRHVLNGVRSCPHSFPLHSAVGLPLQSLRRGGRNSSIWWIDNHGCSQLRYVSRLTPVQTKLSEIVVHVRYSSGIGLRLFTFCGLLFNLDHFLWVIKLFRNAIRALQWRIRGIRPIPLQVGLAIRSFCRPFLRRGGGFCR